MIIWGGCMVLSGLPRALVVKNPPADAGDTGDARDLGLIPGLGRSPRGGRATPRQYSGLENPMTQEPGGLQSTGLHRVRRN